MNDLSVEQQRARASRANRRLLIWVATIGVTLVLLTAWSKGTFDRALYNVGLNAKPCATNGFGATFCGDQLIEYQKRVKSLDH